MGKVIRPFCWHQKFISLGLSTPAPELYTRIKSWKNYIQSDFKGMFLNLQQMIWLCWGLTSQSTIFQSYRDGAIASWVINQYFRGVKCLAQGHNTATVGLEPRTSRSGVRHSTTEPPRSPLQQMNEVTRHFSWNHNFVPWGLSAPAPGLYKYIKSWKALFTIRFYFGYYCCHITTKFAVGISENQEKPPTLY